MKKLIPLLLCIAFALSVVSCAQTEENADGPTYDGSGTGRYDMDGAVVEACISTTPTYNNQSVLGGFYDEDVLGYIANTVLGDLALKRINDVQSQMNMKINFSYIDRPGTQIYYDALAGYNRYDYVQDTTYWLSDYVYTGLFSDLAVLDSLDYTDQSKWGKPNQLEPMMHDGGLYGVFPASFPILGQCSPSLAIIIDEGYIKQMGTADPRDLYEQGKWTWDTFENCLTEYTSADLGHGKQVYAMGVWTDWLGLGGMLSNGSQFAYLTENDTLELGAYTPEAYDAFMRTWNWQWGEYKDCILPVGYGDYCDHFVLRDCVMYLCGTDVVLGSTKAAAYVYDDFGLVQYPTGPKATSRDVPNWFNGLNYALSIPLFASDEEMSATVINALYSPLEGFETRSSIVNYLSDNYFFDRRDAEVYMKYTDMMYYQYYRETGDVGYSQINRFGKDVAQSIEAGRDKDYEIYNKYALEKKLTIKELYPDE